jgi:hypothetical protein
VPLRDPGLFFVDRLQERQTSDLEGLQGSDVEGLVASVWGTSASPRLHLAIMIAQLSHVIKWML